MAIAAQITSVAAPQFSLSKLTEGFRARVAAYRMYRQTRNELQSLSGRDLADLGLHRSMIEGIAREAAYGKI